MTPPTLLAELANAVRRVNAAFSRLDADEQESVRFVGDAPLDTALLAGERAKAIAQIEAWRDRQLAAIEEAVR